jgi:hypothetical protein
MSPRSQAWMPRNLARMPAVTGSIQAVRGSAVAPGRAKAGLGRGCSRSRQPAPAGLEPVTQGSQFGQIGIKSEGLTRRTW